MASIIGMIAGGVAILSSLVALAYNMGRVSMSLANVAKISTKTYNIVVKQDNRIQTLENTTVKRDEFHVLENKVSKIETAHNLYHRKD